MHTSPMSMHSYPRPCTNPSSCTHLRASVCGSPFAPSAAPTLPPTPPPPPACPLGPLSPPKQHRAAPRPTALLPSRQQQGRAMAVPLSSPRKQGWAIVVALSRALSGASPVGRGNGLAPRTPMGAWSGCPPPLEPAVFHDHHMSSRLGVACA